MDPNSHQVQIPATAGGTWFAPIRLQKSSPNYKPGGDSC